MALSELVLVAMLAAQAASQPDRASPASEAAGRAYLQQLQAQMQVSSSARERALAARMDLVLHPSAGGKALRAAAQAAPTDALVQMMWSTSGARWSGCDVRSPCPEQPQAWARVEPKNGLAWLPSFEAHDKGGGDRAVDAAIARIAHAPNYDDHVIEAWQAYRRAIAARPMPAMGVASLAGTAKSADPKEAREEAEGLLAMNNAATMIQPMISLHHACNRAMHPQLPARRFEDCARIGRGIMRSDASTATKISGSTLVRASGLENEADREARRALDWRQQSTVELMNKAGTGEMSGYFADLAATGSETRAQELLMSRHGISLTPARGWKSSY